MFYIKGYLKTFLFLIISCYIHAGQTAPKSCQSSFLKRPTVSQMIRMLQSENSLENKEQALKFFEHHNVTDFRVHVFLLNLLYRKLPAGLRQSVVNTLTERGEALASVFEYETSRLKKWYIKVMMSQIEQGLHGVLRYDPSIDMRLFMIENTYYVMDHKAQKYLAQLLSHPHLKIRSAVEEHLTSILNIYWEQVKMFEEGVNQGFDSIPPLVSVLADEDVQYSSSLHRHLSRILKKSSIRSVHMIALEFLNTIYEIELMKLSFIEMVEDNFFSEEDAEPVLESVDKMQEEVERAEVVEDQFFSDADIEQMSKDMDKVQQRAEKVIREIQKTLVDVIQSESEINYTLIVKCIDFLGKIEIFSHEARVLLEDIRDDKSIFNKIRKSAEQALDNMEAIDPQYIIKK
ncbi:MAG: hypothetical protein OXK80_05895 [Bdellovibrionales bacterium]|nr:hypothetical protein [Bdellovibrionales bacterium]